MSNSDYYAEMATYYFTDYDFYKKSDIRCENIKKMSIELLEKSIDVLKSMLPEDNTSKKGKMIKLNPIINTKNQLPMKKTNQPE